MSKPPPEKTGPDICNAAYEALRNDPLVLRETITQKFYFVQGFKAGVHAYFTMNGEARREMLKFVDNGFFFAKAAEQNGRNDKPIPSAEGSSAADVTYRPVNPKTLE